MTKFNCISFNAWNIFEKDQWCVIRELSVRNARNLAGEDNLPGQSVALSGETERK